MVMDANALQSDLLALKTLYRLLKKDGDAPNDSLDNHARSLLKNLLDPATQRLLNEHSEFIAASKLPITTSEVSQSREKEMESDKDSKADGLDITLWKEKRLNPRWNQPVGVEQLMPSVLPTRVGLGMNRCRLCRRNTINLMKPLEETHFYNGHEDIDCLSKEASDAIEHIDLYMSALCLRADPLHQVPSTDADDMNQTYWLLNQTSYPGKPIEPGMRSNDFVPRNVQNPNAQLDPTRKSLRAPTWPVTISGASKMEGPKEEYDRFRPIHFMKTNNSQVSDSSRPSKLSDFRGKQLDLQHRDGKRKNKQYINSRRVSLLEEESEGSTATDSYSEWTSDQTGSDSEEYSSAGQTEEEETSSGSWSESGASSPLSIEDDDDDNDDDDGYSSSIRAESQESISSASFKIKGYSNSSSSKKPGPSRILKANGKKFKEGNGMWKKMKDKIEIIFHHHHHHHHHGDSKTETRKDKRKAVDFDRREKEAYGEKTAEKVEKSMIRGKGQKGDFRGMMGGFLKHVRHSKQLKEKALKKSHLSKGLQQHRRMNKLTKKNRVKLGLSKRKTGLKTLPDVK